MCKKKYSELRNSTIKGKDATIGVLSDALVDYECWTIRYLVVSSTTAPKDFIISPAVINNAESSLTSIKIELTRQQLFQSPQPDLENRLDRLSEAQIVQFFRWPIYWLGRIAEATPVSINWLRQFEIESTSYSLGSLTDFDVQLPTWNITSGIQGRIPVAPETRFPIQHVQEIDFARKKLKVDKPSSRMDLSTKYGQSRDTNGHS